MAKINKPTSPENQIPQAGQTKITDTTNSQLLQILPSEDDEDILIGQEIEGFGNIEEIIGSDKLESRDVILVRSDHSTKFYIYKDTHTVVSIHDNIGRPRGEYVGEIKERLSIFGENILRTKTSHPFDVFLYENSLKPYLLNKTDKVIDIQQRNIGDKKVIVFKSVKGSEVIDANTGEYLYAEHRYNRVKTKIIDILSDRESPIIKLWDKRSLKKVTIEKEHQNTYIDIKTLKIFYVEEIYGNIENIENEHYHIGNHQFLKCCITNHPFQKYYYIHKDTGELFTIPGTNYVVEGYAPGVSPTSKIWPISSGEKFLEHTLFSVFAHEIDNNKKRILFTLDQDSLQEVKLPGTDFVVSDVEYKARNAITFADKSYSQVSIFDEQGEWKLYFSPEDNSIAHISTIDGEQHIVNSLGFPTPSYGSRSGSYQKKALSVGGIEIMQAFINKGKDGVLVDKKTFQELIIGIAGTEEEINLIRYDVLDVGGKEVLQVETKSGRTMYVYKEKLTPLQIPGVEGYIEDIKELGDGKWNMKINGKWNLVRVK